MNYNHFSAQNKRDLPPAQMTETTEVDVEAISELAAAFLNLANKNDAGEPEILEACALVLGHALGVEKCARCRASRYKELIASIAKNMELAAQLLEDTAPIPPPTDARAVDVLGLNKRAMNALRDAHIATVGDLMSRTEMQVRLLPGITKVTLANIKERLAANGLVLAKAA